MAAEGVAAEGVALEGRGLAPPRGGAAAGRAGRQHLFLAGS